jgi:hypothetical protein
MDNKDIHTEHCCAECGTCKYGEDVAEEDGYEGEPFISCSVVSGRKQQSLEHGKTYVCGNYHCYDNHND